jgi:hypothetical protein
MINAKLQNIIDTKSAIGNAIVNKGGTITGETPFFNYAAQIDGISTGSVLTGNATTNVVFDGFTFYGNDANTQLTGTFVFDGNAAVGNVETGKTFFATNGTKLTGTGALASAPTTNESIMTLIDAYPKGAMVSSNTSTTMEHKVNNGFLYVGRSTDGNFLKINTVDMSLINNLPNYGVLPTFIETFNGSVYLTGEGNYANGTVQKIYEGNFTKDINSANYNRGYSIGSNNNFIYITVFNNTVLKLHAGNLGLSANSAVYDFMGNIVVNNGFVYTSSGFPTRVIRKFHESNLVLSANTSDLGSGPALMAINNGFIFAALTSSTGVNGHIQKIHDGNLAVNIVSGFTHEGAGRGVAVNNGYVYAISANVAHKLLESNLAYQANVIEPYRLLTQNIEYSNGYVYYKNNEKIVKVQTNATTITASGNTYLKL